MISDCRIEVTTSLVAQGLSAFVVDDVIVEALRANEEGGLWSHRRAIVGTCFCVIHRSFQLSVPRVVTFQIHTHTMIEARHQLHITISIGDCHKSLIGNLHVRVVVALAVNQFIIICTCIAFLFQRNHFGAN